MFAASSLRVGRRFFDFGDSQHLLQFMPRPLAAGRALADFAGFDRLRQRGNKAMTDCSTRIGGKILSLLAVVFAALFAATERAGRVWADEPVATEPAPDADEVRRWINELESPSQATRGAAQAALLRAGEAALEQVTAAARSPNPEVRLRCVEVLRRHAAGDAAALAQAGQSALDELAKATETSVARAAESAIAANARRRAADEATKYQDRILVRGGGAIIRLRPAVLPKAVAALPAGARSVSVSVINGRRTILATSDEETVAISDGGDDGIKMSITKKVAGKEKKESFAAKDAAELKAKHAEAFKVYERYAKDGGGRVVLDEIRARREKAE
jgi:hypothetical protein